MLNEASCWRCGGDGVSVMHCVVCDLDREVCKCPHYVWYQIYRCALCDATW